MSNSRLARGLAALVVLSVSLASVSSASEMGAAAADEVSQANYYNLMNLWLFTHAGNSRGPSGAQHDPARDNILALFQSYGLSAALEPFTWSGQSGENVVATQVGTLYPNRIIVIGSHYDSVSNPGADDNASGSAAVLEVARIVSQYPSAYTIKYVTFDLEELGLYGSHAFVAAHPSYDIRGMISLDMVAYDTSTNNALIYGRTTSNPIKNALQAAVAEYSGGLTTTINGQLDQSDHAPFEAGGWQACLLIEGQVWSNPYYHTQNDKFESTNYLNFPYATKMVRSVVGWLVDAAEVTVPVDALTFAYPDGLPEYCRPNGTTGIEVQIVPLGNEIPQPDSLVLHYNYGLGWQVQPADEIAPDVYRVSLPPTACGATLRYYFSAVGTDGRVFTAPRTAPGDSYSALASYGVETFYVNTLDTNPGWTANTLWAYGHPTGGGGEHGSPDPANGHTGTNVLGYNLAGDYENSIAEKHLTSTALNCAGRHGVHLQFWRWLGVEQPTYDHAYVRVSNNNSIWTTVWQNTAEVADSSWQFVDLDISAVADNSPTVYLRWTMGTTDTSWRYCGWNIDDISLTSLTCTAPFIAGDVNCDGQVDFADIDPFVLALTGHDGYDAAYPDCHWLAADANADNSVDFADIDPFVALLGG